MGKKWLLGILSSCFVLTSNASDEILQRKMHVCHKLKRLSSDERRSIKLNCERSDEIEVNASIELLRRNLQKIYAQCENLSPQEIKAIIIRLKNLEKEFSMKNLSLIAKELINLYNLVRNDHVNYRLVKDAYKAIQFFQSRRSIEGIKLNGGNGATLLYSLNKNQASFVHKAFRPKIKIQHRSFQSFLPKYFFDFRTVPSNEVVASKMAMKIDLVKKHQLVPEAIELISTELEEQDLRGIFIKYEKDYSDLSKIKSTDKALEFLKTCKEKLTTAAIFSLLLNHIDFHKNNLLLHNDIIEAINQGKMPKKSCQEMERPFIMIDFGLTMPSYNYFNHKRPFIADIDPKEKVDGQVIKDFQEEIKVLRPQLLKMIDDNYSLSDAEIIKIRLQDRIDYIQQISPSQSMNYAELLRPLTTGNWNYLAF